MKNVKSSEPPIRKRLRPSQVPTSRPKETVVEDKLEEEEKEEELNWESKESDETSTNSSTNKINKQNEVNPNSNLSKEKVSFFFEYLTIIRINPQNNLEPPKRQDSPARSSKLSSNASTVN